MSRVPAWDMCERLALGYHLTLSILNFMVWFPFRDNEGCHYRLFIVWGVCMGVCMGEGYICVRGHALVCVCMYTYVEARGQYLESFFRCPPCSLRHCPSLIWYLPSGLGWLTSKTQSSSSLLPPSSGIIDTCHHAQILGQLLFQICCTCSTMCPCC